MYALADLITDLHEDGTEVYFAELHREPREILANLGVVPGIIPEDHMFERAEDAIRKATHGEKIRLKEDISSSQALSYENV
ncbi:MAG: STAS domain-containing protein [Proteobacteria bacterium]|nr:STAS domain-containing protein [Pseudomonadota bacterium]